MARFQNRFWTKVRLRAGDRVKECCKTVRHDCNRSAASCGLAEDIQGRKWMEAGILWMHRPWNYEIIAAKRWHHDFPHIAGPALESAAAIASGLRAPARLDPPSIAGRRVVPDAAGRAREVVYLHLPVRRTESARLLGPQAGWSLRGSRPLLHALGVLPQTPISADGFSLRASTGSPIVDLF